VNTTRPVSLLCLRLFAVLANLLLLAGNTGAFQPPVPASVPLLPSASGAGNSYAPAFSADGRVIVFLSHANNLVTNDDRAPHLDLFARDRLTGNTVLVSVNTNGFGGGNASIGVFSVSSNGQFIVFESAASNLAPGDSNGTSDVFLRDIAAGTTRLISRNFSGTGSANGPSRAPQIFADAPRIAFESTASDLVSGDTNGLSDIFVHAVDTGLNVLASTNATAAGPASGPCESAALSMDGRYVAFVKRAGNTIPGSALTTFGDIYLRDIDAAVTLHVSTNVASRMVFGSASITCFNPVLSSDGRFVAFLAQGLTPAAQLFWRDMSSPSTTSVSSNVPPDSVPAMSADGRFLAYVGGGIAGSPTYTNGLYIWDGAGLSNRLVSPITFQSQPSLSRLSGKPAISADGSRVAYFDFTNFLNATTLSIHDWITGSNRVVLAADGNPAPPYDASFPVLSADGRLLAFESIADNIVADDQNGAVDVFLADVETGDISLVSQRHSTLPARTGRGIASIGPGSLSGDGRRVAFVQHDSGLRALSSNRWADAVLRDLVAGTNSLLSANFLIANPYPFPGSFLLPPTNRILQPKLSADGRITSFSGSRFLTNTFWRDLAGDTNRGFYIRAGSAPSMSADGRIVAFSFDDDFFFNGVPDNNHASDVLLFAPDRKNLPQAAPELVPVSVTSQNRYQLGNAHSINAVVSADGGWITFQSLATDITPDPDLLLPVYQLFAGRVTRNPTNTDVGDNRLVSYSTIASLAPAGVSAQTPLTAGATNAVFSANSRFLFFEAPGTRAIFRHDLSLDYVTNITSSMGLLFTNRARLTNLAVCVDCANPAPDFAGRLVAYESTITNATRQIWLRDLLTGAQELISATPNGTPGDDASTGPLLSPDGRYVVFSSRASDLAPNDSNRASDVFVRDRHTGLTHCLSLNRFGTATGNRPSSNPVLSPDGRTVAFQSFASDLVDRDYNDTRDVFVVSLAGPDTDGDGLDDDWEVTFFNNLSRDGTGDFDGDGVSDAEEFRQGTDPTNAGSVFRVLTLTTVVGPQTFLPRTTTVYWAATPFRSYRVQFKTDLAASASWTDLPGDVLATSNTASKTHLLYGPLSPRAYYRVRLLE